MAFIFCCPVSTPDDLFLLLTFGFGGVHCYSSSPHLIELSPILRIKVGQFVKTKFIYHMIILFLHPNTAVQ